MKARKKVATTFRRISLLLWKNILFRRKWLMIFLTFMEIVAPTLLVGGLAYYRTIVDNDTGIKETNFTYFSNYPEEDLLRPAQRKLKNTIFAYLPDNNLTREIMELVKGRLNAKAEIRPFDSEEELEEFVEDSEIPLTDYKIRKKKVGAAIIFGSAFQKPNETLYMYNPETLQDYRINYTIRIPHYTIDTGHLVGLLQLPGPQHDNAQSYRGAAFTGIQIALDKTIINFLTGKEPPAGISQEIFPYPPYDTTKFNTIFFIPMPAIIVLGFIFIVPSIMRNVVSERHTGIKELMKIMGLPNWMHWLGWMINTLLVLVFSISIVIFLFFYAIDETKGGIVTEGSLTVWWIVMLLYAMAATSFCFFISVFTTNPVMATTTGIVLWLLSYFLVAVPLALDYENISFTKKVISSILPNTGLHWAIGVMATLEGKGIGAHWWNINQPGSTLDGVSVLHIMLMLIFDAIFYIFLAMYFENVLPSKYGIRQPWYYPILPSTWFNVKPKKGGRTYCSSTWNSGTEKPGFECEPGNLNAGIEIQNLSKTYGKKVAVNGISIKMYQGQITALLGHNGAGKTTTLSILTGLFPPSNGTASINGYDIREELDRVRENLGLCPQHNMLFDDLTVLEHLKFFGRLKGLSAFEAHYEAISLIKKLQLKSKKHVAASSLSGGQKRKLSLGLALIGGSKVVILDEPTSGMDPEARRVIWDLLLGLRGERTIVLTTHFMEEADILGDRIAVMANGQLQCCGTPLYLKKYFGAGYILKLTVDNTRKTHNQNSSILQAVKNHIPDGYLMKEEKSGHDAIEMSISIPCDETTGPKLPAMFKDLDGHKDTLGIQTIGLSLSTIEDVFLALEENNRKESAIEMDDAPQKNGVAMAGSERQIRHPSIFKQVYGLLMKKTVYTLRKRKILAGQFLMPPIMIIVAILIFNTFYVPRENYPSRDISLSQYKDPIVVYRTDDDNIAKAFAGVVGDKGEAVRVIDKSLINELGEISLKDLGVYRDHYIVGGDFNDTAYNTLYSTIPYHAAPLSINLATNTLLRTMSNKTYSIDAAFHPLHNLLFSKLEIVKPSRHHFMDGPVMLGIFVPIGLALFASSFLVFPTEERRTQAKQLQLMTGVHPITFWITSFIFDFTLMVLACCLMIAVIPLFGLERFTGTFTNDNALGALFLILIVYGYSAISFSYIFSLVFSSVSLGYSLSTILHLVTGLIIPLIVFIMDTLVKAGGTPRLILRFVARIFTTYGVSVSIMRYSSISILNSRCEMLSDAEKEVICDPKNQIDANIRQCCSNCANLTNYENIKQCFEPQKYFTWNYTMIDERDFQEYEVPGIGQEMLYMVIMGIIYMVIILLIESPLGRIIKTTFTRSRDAKVVVNDVDVIAEQDRISSMNNKGDDALVVTNLTKHYGNFAAVRNLSFGVHHGECFGLLGVNGAGKTTSFRMLTGDETPTYGDAFSLSNSLNGSRKEFLKNIGYCPQFDAIIGCLTGREMLKLFCHLRGVPGKDIDGQVNKWLKKLGLFKSGDVECRNYSGGMKRRLSVGLAMIGDPPVVFLDEPTSGVDPVSRRQFWEVIASAKTLGQSIVLTSHSMEECEALCQRLSIMVNGQFQCLGGVEQLKQKFAKGYTIVFRLRSLGLDPERVMALKQEVEQTFTPCMLKDEHQNVIDYQVYNTEMSWDVIFGAMEAFKQKYNDLIEDYTVSKTTLEEVFLAFAKLQHSGDRTVKYDCLNFLKAGNILSKL